MVEKPLHIRILNDSLSRRQRSNAAYSLRAFGRDLGIDPSTLSQVMNQKRALPLKAARRIVDRLELPPIAQMHFLESVAAKRTILDQIHIPSVRERFLLDESHYRIIAEWEHYAALTLFDTIGFVATVDSVAGGLGITRRRAQTVLDHLSDGSLIRALPDGKYEKTHVVVRTTEDIASPALRASHLETLEIGKRKLTEIPLEDRDYSCENFALDPEDLPELKQAIREFREKISMFAARGKNRRRVYQMAIQVYPLSTDSESRLESTHKKEKRT